MLSVFLFAGTAVLVYTGFLDSIESRLYNPALTETLIRETAKDAKVLSEQLSELQDRFSGLLRNQPVRRSFLPGQSAADIYERSMVFGSLLESVPGLQSVRFIDSDGIRIHFSTLALDILEADGASIRYRNYNDAADNLPFSAFFTQEQTKLILDKAGDRIIFSLPFNDSLDSYRGVALFTVSVNALTKGFAAAGRLALCVNPPGIVAGLPAISGEEILARISMVWEDGYRSIVPFLSAGMTLALVSVRMDQGLYYGRIVHEDVFLFPRQIRILTLTAFFVTMFLVIFFFFNVRQRPRKQARNGDNAIAAHEHEKLEEPEAAPEVKHGKGLLAAALMVSSSGIKERVILEQNGIPYINHDVFIADKNTQEKLDNNFMKLIDAVVNKA